MTHRVIIAQVAVLAGVALLSRCSTNRKSVGLGPNHIAKIKVSRDGAIVLNDETVTLEHVKATLFKLSQSGDAGVWYYRENPGGDPHPNAMLVLQAIVDAKLPVSFRRNLSGTTRPSVCATA